MLRQLLIGRPAGEQDTDGDPPGAGELLPERDRWRDDLTGGHHLLAYLRDLVRGNGVPRIHLPDVADARRPPVLLIHGFLGTRGSMMMLERRMARDGLTVFTFNLGLVNKSDIRESALRIQAKVDAILAQVNVDKVDIVGHSMGGLIGLYYIKRLGGAAKVGKLVMMGTPIMGTWSALLGVVTIGLLSPGSWQILPSSRFLADLRRDPLPAGIRCYTIAAERDWVCPPHATCLPGAVRMTVPLGHSSLVISNEVYGCLQRALLDDEPAR